MEKRRCCGILHGSFRSKGKKVAVIDERGEFAGGSGGGAERPWALLRHFGRLPEARGMLQALRGLSPDYIVCDELGGTEDAEAVAQALCAGAVVIASVHAGRAGGPAPTAANSGALGEQCVRKRRYHAGSYSAGNRQKLDEGGICLKTAGILMMVAACAFARWARALRLGGLKNWNASGGLASDLYGNPFFGGAVGS